MISNKPSMIRCNNGSFFDQLEARALLANDGPKATIFEGDKAIQEVMQGDFDRDGKMDLVLTRATELTFLKNLGDGKYDEPRTIRLNANIGKVAKGRLNCDTLPDLASVVRLANGDTLVRVLFFDAGAGTFVTGPRLVLPGSQGNVKEISTIDIAGDVRSEIVLNTNSSIRLLSLPDRTRIIDNGVVPPTIGTNVQSVVGDLNNNGRTELLVTGSFGSYIIGRTPSSIGVTITPGPAVNARNAFVADVDDDNLNDIVWAAGSSIYMIRGTGDGNFAPPAAIMTRNDGRETTLTVAGVADIDRDGRKDLLVEALSSREDRVETYYSFQGIALLQTESGAWLQHLINSQEQVRDFDDPRPLTFADWRMTFATQDSAADILRIGRTSIDLFTNLPEGITPTLDSVVLSTTSLSMSAFPNTVGITFTWTNVDFVVAGERNVTNLRLYRDLNDDGILDDGDLLIVDNEYEFPELAPPSPYSIGKTIDSSWGDLGTFRLIGELVYDDGDAGPQSLTLLLPDLYTLS